MSGHELDPVECQSMGISLEAAQRILDGMKDQRGAIKRQDADMGVDTPSPAGRIPDFVTLRAARVVTLSETQVE
jgi:hypothetical protein